MEITIKQRWITAGSEYDISTPDRNYYASQGVFSSGVTLREPSEDGPVIARIKHRWSFFRSRYDIAFTSGRRYRFECEKRWPTVYACWDARNAFRLYPHKGHKFSIFRNQTQIAAVSTNTFKLGKGDRYSIEADSAADSLVLICMVLAFDVSIGNSCDNYGLIIDMGNVGPEDRPFDHSWAPK